MDEILVGDDVGAALAALTERLGYVSLRVDFCATSRFPFSARIVRRSDEMDICGYGGTLGEALQLAAQQAAEWYED